MLNYNYSSMLNKLLGNKIKNGITKSGELIMYL